MLGFFTANEAIKHLGKALLLIAVFYEPARAVNIIGGSALKTVGDARFPLVVGNAFIWGILPVVYVVNRVWGLTIVGFWLFFGADEIIRAGINLWRWRTGRWKSMGIAQPAAGGRRPELKRISVRQRETRWSGGDPPPGEAASPLPPDLPNKRGRAAAPRIASACSPNSASAQPLTFAYAHSIQGRTFSMSEVSTVAPHQNRRPAGASL